LRLRRWSRPLLAIAANVAVVLARSASAEDSADPAKVPDPRQPDAKSVARTVKQTDPRSPDEAAKALSLVLADLSKRLGAFKTMRCRFEQRRYLAVFEEVVTSEGTLALAVPDRLRWETTRPIRSVLTVDGREAMRERTSRKGRTTRRTFSLDDDPVAAITVQQVFLWLRGDFAKAAESYDLALVTEKPLVLRATPKDGRVKDVLTSIELTFSAARDRLTGVTLAEKHDARTAIAYLDVEIDPELPASLFAIRNAGARPAAGK